MLIELKEQTLFLNGIPFLRKDLPLVLRIAEEDVTFHIENNQISANGDLKGTKIDIPDKDVERGFDKSSPYTLARRFTDIRIVLIEALGIRNKCYGKCHTCRLPNPVMFILKEHLWYRYARHRRELLCLYCMEERMERLITPDDLMDGPISNLHIEKAIQTGGERAEEFFRIYLEEARK